MRSMTGYGRGEAGTAPGFLVEIKAVNHRFADIQMHLPRACWAWEEQIRSAVMQIVERGRVEVHVELRGAESTLRRPRIDTVLAHAYHNALMQLANSLHLSWHPEVAELAALPGVVTLEEGEPELDTGWPSLQAALAQALAGLSAMRQAEGAALQQDMATQLERLQNRVSGLRKRLPELMAEARARLQKRLQEWLQEAPLAAERLEQEAALLAERSDITEEVVRLDSHLEQLRATLNQQGSVGRKLDFLLQECHREVNTIGSKTQDLLVSQTVVALKTELERLRQQAHNVE